MIRPRLWAVLSLPFVAIILIAGGLIGYLGFHNAQHAVTDLASQLHEQATARVAGYLDMFMATPQLINRLNLDSIKAGELNLDDLPGTGRHLFNQLLRFDTVVTIEFADEKGNYVGPVRNIMGAGLAYGASGKDSSNTYILREIKPDGATGKTLMEVPHYDSRGKPWYRAAVQAGRPTWTPIYVWPNGDVGLDAVAPVNTNGTLLGVLDTSITLTSIGDLLNRMRPTANSEIYIVDRAGLLVATSGIEPPYRKSGEECQRLSATACSNAMICRTMALFGKEYGGIQGVTAQHEFVCDDGRGGQAVGMVSPYRDAYGLDWVVVTVTPRADLTARIDAHNRTTVLLIAWAMMVAIVVALVMARRVTRPLSHLSTSAQALARGEWTRSVVLNRRDEVGDLAQAFNTMAAQLTENLTSLRESEARFRALVEQAPEAIVVFDLDAQRFVDANTNAELLFGCDHAHLLDAGPERFCSASDPDAARFSALFLQRCQKALAGATVVFESTVRNMQGGDVPCEVRLVSFPSTKQRLVRGSYVDITARKEAEAHREKLETELRQAHKMEAIGRLAGGIAHDFNNMLNVIMGYSDLVLMKLGETDPIREDIGEIAKAAKRSADLTRQLLAFSRRQTIAPVAVDLNIQLQSMERLLRRAIGEDVELTFALAPRLWSIRMDPSQVDQVASNLAINARDAMPNGGRLTVATANLTLDTPQPAEYVDLVPGEYVVLAVTDTGCGMDSTTLEHVFEPFFTTKAADKGTGLGLATVYGIVQQNGGHIGIRSEPGHGTSVRVYFPRCHDQQAMPPAAVRTQQVLAGHETVLLVEDHPQMRRVTALMLEDIGYTVLAAESPAVALKLCQQHRQAIDVLLTDVVMPGMNGHELAEQVVRVRPGIKTVFMSGYSSHATNSHGVIEDGIHFLQKPFLRDDLARKLRHVIDG